MIWQEVFGAIWGALSLVILGAGIYCGFVLLAPGRSRTAVSGLSGAAFVLAAAGAAWSLGCAAAFVKGVA